MGSNATVKSSASAEFLFRSTERLEWAARIEWTEGYSAVCAALGRKRWNPRIHIDWRWNASTCAVFAGHWTHLTQAYAFTECLDRDAVNAVESLHRRLLALPTLHVSSLFAPAIKAVEKHGFQFLGASDVFGRVPGDRMAAARAEITVAPVKAGDQDTWIHAVSAACLDQESASGDQLEIGGLVSRMPGTVLFRATRGNDLAGGGALFVRDRTAILFCDATLPSYRGMGIQQELILERMRFAESQGCDLVTATAISGSPSARNYQRCGFRKLYSRLTFQLR